MHIIITRIFVRVIVNGWKWVYNGHMIGERVKQLRELKGWSQGKLSLLAGLSRSYISKLEANEYESPGSEQIQKIAEVLGVDSNYLITGISNETPVYLGKAIDIILPREIIDNPELTAELKNFISYLQWKARKNIQVRNN